MTNKENVLGFGISVTRFPDSGVISSVSSAFDVISLRAYLKETRVSLNNESFTYFLPLYFGTEKEFTLQYARKALSIICKDVSNGFEPALVLEVLPKILVTTVIDFADNNIYYSVNNLKFFVYVYRLFHLFISEHPEIMTMINEKIEVFLESADNRAKSVTPNLGDLMIYTLLSDTYRWENIREAYVHEQLDRQVLWLLKQIPELELSEFNEFDSVRAKASFKVGKVGFRYCCFLSKFMRLVKEGEEVRDSNEKMMQMLDEN